MRRPSLVVVLVALLAGCASGGNARRDADVARVGSRATAMEVAPAVATEDDDVATTLVATFFGR